MASTTQPLVSVCMPVLNGGDLAVRAVESALAQDHPNLEVIVVDDASTDGTGALLRSRFGQRVLVLTNTSRLGQGPSLNRALREARGSLVKFLDHDDQLDPDCVSSLVAPFAEHAAVGLAFSRRRLEVHGELRERPGWREEFEEVHTGFSNLEGLNPGPHLFKQLIRAGLRSNWVGEPCVVMVRRQCLRAVGGFSARTRHWTDFDLWVRLLAEFDAAFIDRELATYRRAAGSLSARNAATGNAWLDRLWIIEALLSVPSIRSRFPELLDLRRKERRSAWRTAVKSAAGLSEAPAPPMRWLEYMGFRLRRRISPVEIAGKV